MGLRDRLLKIRSYMYYDRGKSFLNDPHYLETQRKEDVEYSKSPSRTTVINFLLSLQKNDTCYLEIGVRKPEDNFNHIRANKKYSVDPGIMYKPNPVDFKMTSDVFFQKLAQNEILDSNIRFDGSFIDGLHLAEQVDRDVENAFNYLKEDGFIVLHDCNPPSEGHARENLDYRDTPAGDNWNGTTWKAFLKWRCDPSVYSCCIDSDWGIGILSKKHPIGKNKNSVNTFFEFYDLDKNRKEYLNLIDFEDFKIG